MPVASRVDSVNPGKSPKRKRSRDESDENNEEGKRRGRPRLDTQDESAADRRRTQIRVAQRAYRQRKESTIDELRNQVQELQATVKSMNKTFSDISQKCSTTNDPPAVLAAVRILAQSYSSNHNRAESVSSDNSPDSTSHNSGYDANVKDEDVSSSTTRPSVVETESSSSTSQDAFSEGGLRFETVERDPAAMALLRSLEGPHTYSQYENTFARRLHRASCEYAYRLACDPTRVPALFDNVFKLTLKAAGSVERVKFSLQSTLNRSSREPLSNWGVTYIHVGGAGTHYPRPLEEGGMNYQSPSSWAVTSVGPHKIGGSTIEEVITAEMLLRGTPQMEGEWFDAYDVQGYLAEKYGLHLEPGSTFAEVDLAGDISLSPRSTEVPCSLDQTTKSSDSGIYADYYANTTGMEYMPAPLNGPVYRGTQLESWSHLPPSTGERRSIVHANQQYGSGISGSGNMYAFGYQPVKRRHTTTIDVAEFVRQMTLAGTCLMRAPGFRRKDIDIALRRSVIQSH